MQWAVSLPSLKHTHFCGEKHGWFLLRAMNKEWNFFSHKIQLRFCHQMSLLQTYKKKINCVLTCRTFRFQSCSQGPGPYLHFSGEETGAGARGWVAAWASS